MYGTFDDDTRHVLRVSVLVTTISSILYIASLKSFRLLSQNWKSYKSLEASQQLQWVARAPSSFHAVAAITTIGYTFLLTNSFGDPSNPSPYVFQTSTISITALSISLGYFITDSAMLILYYPAFGTGVMALHHVAALASVLASLYYQQGHAYTLLLLSTEITTPFINLRWLLDKAGYSSHPVYIINGLFTMCTWGFCRIYLFVSYFFTLAYIKHRSELSLMALPCQALVLLVPPLLLCLNVFWFTKMLKMLFRVVFDRKEKSS